jgi:thiol:disulfide interchange protein DsbD
MTSPRYWKIARPAAAALLCLASQAQTNVLAIEPPPKLTAKRGEAVSTTLKVELLHGYHVNSHTPSDEYLIPLRLSWEAQPLEVLGVDFPKPKMERYGFSDKPLSVFTGDFEIVTRLRVPASATAGPRTMTGKLRYQACNDRMCLPPRTVEVKLPVEIR